MKTSTLGCSVVLFMLAASSQALTIATFDDPALSGATPLFTVTNSSVVGSWTGSGLTLKVPYVSLTYSDVKMNLSSVSRAGTVLGGGTVLFYTSDINAPIFTINFDSGMIFEPFAAGASTFVANNVDFGGSALTGLDPLVNEQFAFSFANPVGFNTNTRTYTAAMTSSADAVPEPATLALATAAFLAMARRKHKQS